MTGRRLTVAAVLAAALCLAALAARDPLAGLAIRAGLPSLGALAAADPALQGIARYEAGDHAGAVEAFRRSARPEAAYNLGNALARAGRPQEAVKAYRVALLRDPDDRDAAANLALVEAAIAASVAEEESDRIEGRGATAQREMDNRDNAAADEQAEVRATSGDGLAGQREAGGSAAAAGSSRVDRRGDGGNDSSEDGEGSSKGAAADTAGRSGKSGGLTTVAVSDDAPPRAEAGPAEVETGQATRQWLAAIPDDPVLFVRLRILAERQKRLADGTALRVGGTAW